MDAPITVIRDFVPQDEINSIVNRIDLLEKDNFDMFAKDQAGLRLALQVGGVGDHPDAHKGLGAHLGMLSEDRPLFEGYFQKVVQSVKDSFNIDKDLYMCSFWLAKQYPGATVPIHDDTDSGFSPQNNYSGIVYLNTMQDGGDLSFVNFDYTYKPEAGSLVIFPSKEGGLHGVSRIDEIRYSLLFWMTFDKSKALV